MITSYGTLTSAKGGAALQRHVWRRVVLDEAHTIKGRATQQAKAAFALDCECRWAVSGTPVQNALDDLFSLLHFLRLAPFDDYAYWRQNVLQPIEERQGAEKVIAASGTSPTPSLTRPRHPP